MKGDQSFRSTTISFLSFRPTFTNRADIVSRYLETFKTGSQPRQDLKTVVIDIHTIIKTVFQVEDLERSWPIAAMQVLT